MIAEWKMFSAIFTQYLVTRRQRIAKKKENFENYSYKFQCVCGPRCLRGLVSGFDLEQMAFFTL